MVSLTPQQAEPLWRLPAAFLLAAFLALGLPSPVRAATRTVNTLGDVVSATDGKLSLREAVTASVTGDVVRFSVTGTLVLTKGQILIARNLTIQGPGARALTLSGGNKSRIFQVRALAVTFTGLTLAEGLPRGTDGANGAPALGGAFYCEAGSRVSVSNSAFTNNSAIGGNATTGNFGGMGLGGAIYTELDSFLEVRNCTFSGNNARNGSGPAGFSTSAQGGAIFSNGDTSVVHSTFVGNYVSLNQTGTARGGAFFGSLGPVLMVGCTLTNNACFAGPAGSESVGGGIASYGQQPARLLNTIVAGNQTPAADPDVAGPYASYGHNLIGIVGTSTGWGGSDLVGSAASPVDPLFEADFSGNPYLKDNGGPTDTVALQPDSAALNAGDTAVIEPPLNLRTDQRGWPRLGGPRVDIGAHEADPAQAGASLVVTTRDDHDDGTPGLYDCTLREALNASVAGTKTITFKTGLVGTILLKPALGTLLINEPVNVRGPGASKLSLSGGGQVRILRNFSSATLTGLSLISGSDEGSGSGGGIVNAGTLALEGCTLHSCKVTGPGGDGGGAIMNAAPSRLTLRDCTLYGNSAPTRGGAIANLGGTVSLVNTTLTGNSAPLGAGIAVGGNDGIYPRGQLSLLNCTLARNAASSRGGGVVVDPSNLCNVRNSILALNNAPVAPEVSGSVVSQANNVVGRRDGSTGWKTSDRQGTAAAPLDPNLGGRAANGGETPTLALLTGSPAIGFANAAAPPTDQRGYFRSGAPDSGAFEFNGIKPRPPVNVSVSPSSGSSGTRTTRTFTAKYSDPDGVDNLAAVYLLINSSLDPKNAIYVSYNVATNRLSMRNATDSGWVGSAIPGSAAVVSTAGGRGKLHASGVTVQKVGTTLTITWSISALDSFGGAKKVYLYSQDTSGLSDGWDQLGTWSFLQ